MTPIGSTRTLAGDVTHAATIGAQPGGGISRFAWTPELARVTEWVAEEAERLGLEPTIDEAGNLIARWPAPAGKAVMTASHLDTVPEGGPYDGTLGVLAALEAIRLLRADGFEPARPVWIGAFMDEEGARFGSGLFGSRAFCGEDLTDTLQLCDEDGCSVAEAMGAWDRDPAALAGAARVGELAAFVEMHVEQGPVLWQRQVPLGIVEAIVGVQRYSIVIDGAANHAGTTPSGMRQDALVGASRTVLRMHDEMERREDLRATVGVLRVEPGGSNVIPGRCSFTIDLRPTSSEVAATVPAWLEETVAAIAGESDLRVSVRCDYALRPSTMDPLVVGAIEGAIESIGAPALRLVSGAGHDAMVISRHVPTGMLFVPSDSGISHSPLEATKADDCALGARVLAETIRRLAS